MASWRGNDGGEHSLKPYSAEKLAGSTSQGSCENKTGNLNSLDEGQDKNAVDVLLQLLIQRGSKETNSTTGFLIFSPAAGSPYYLVAYRDS